MINGDLWMITPSSIVDLPNIFSAQTRSMLILVDFAADLNEVLLHRMKIHRYELADTFVLYHDSTGRDLSLGLSDNVHLLILQNFSNDFLIYFL